MLRRRYKICAPERPKTIRTLTMPSLHDDSWEGRLTAADLENYLAPNASIIDSPGGHKVITPLAAACWRGHLAIVKLLLNNPIRRADVNALSSHDRTALFCATKFSPSKNRAAIVRALLEAGADVNATSEYDAHNTPLMNAIVELRDKKVIHELVDHGASLNLRNAQHKTAEMLAEEVGLGRELRPRSEIISTLSAIVDFLISLVMHIFGFINQFINGSVKKLFGMSGSQDQEIMQDFAERNSRERKDGHDDVNPGVIPQTAEEFQASLDTYVTKSGLERFFAPGDPFLHNLAEKAAALRDDPSSNLGSPENISRLTCLSLYQPVIYCDDSGSMDKHDRYEHQRELVSRIARIATKIVPDDMGVELRFINAPNPAPNLSAAHIDAAVRMVRPSGGTKIGTVLKDKILQPLVYDILSDPQQKLHRPLLVCTITDGCPSAEAADLFQQTIYQCKRSLVDAGYEPNAVMFCISQIGNDESASAFLEKLRGDQAIQDVLYCTTDKLDDAFKELKENERGLEEWLLKLLTRPIMERDLD
ncbi:hypothetical protein WOLCODRAFT_141893 [Wolfiporia cocos MD-104 SS10]|uniref:Uncharacterized protein n=1 Tax=Wolfiporia cocos (strain MD-104) TaxID=742152 RepID=A0A2H3IX02_WOLCO|nr:hypothetical protein WOLCODRAFT_141893 [Wolfiporia cocos MD-104 SS10]